MIGIISAVAVALVAVLVYFAERREYTVHREGIVLITGASTGIGRDAAEYLASNSDYLVLAGVRKQSDYNSIVEMNKSNLLPLTVDVTSHESCVSAIDQIRSLSESKGLPFVGLVNNAGLGGFNPIEFEDVERAKALFDANVFGVLDLTQLSLPLLRASRGRVIMISSVAGFVSNAFSSVYCASKFAVEAISDALRKEMLAHGVSVSVVQPGYVKTQIIARSINASAEEFEHKKEAMFALYPKTAKRLGMAEMMAKQPGPESTTTPAIVHALTSPFPKTRYPVASANGLSAKTISWLVWALSDRLKDMLPQ